MMHELGTEGSEGASFFMISHIRERFISLSVHFRGSG